MTRDNEKYFSYFIINFLTGKQDKPVNLITAKRVSSTDVSLQINYCDSVNL